MILALIFVIFLVALLILFKIQNNQGVEDPRFAPSTGTTTNKDINYDYHNKQKQKPVIPFFYIASQSSKKGTIDEKDPFLNVAKALHRYQDDVDNFISSMMKNVEIARKTEWALTGTTNSDQKINKQNDYPNLFSSKLEEKIRKIAYYSEQNYFVLENLLKPFEFVIGLPYMQKQSIPKANGDNYFCNDLWIDLSQNEQVPSSSYDSALQVLTHIIRDWSVLGKEIRTNLYDWIISNLLPHKAVIDGPILVPGKRLS
jgi:hypothetical protein